MPTGATACGPYCDDATPIAGFGLDVPRINLRGLLDLGFGGDPLPLPLGSAA